MLSHPSTAAACDSLIICPVSKEASRDLSTGFLAQGTSLHDLGIHRATDLIGGYTAWRQLL